MRRALGGALPEAGESADSVLESLARAADPGIVATAGPRYFGFVVGGTLPVTVAADWLTSTWDQNAGLFVLSPANSVAEETAGGWLRELFGLPAGASVGFVTGCQAANFSALAAARHALLAALRLGCRGPRPLRRARDRSRGRRGGARHRAHRAADARARSRARASRGGGRPGADAPGGRSPTTLAPLAGRPTLVCAQAGNINTGAFDPLVEIADLAAAHGAWLHVDGAFGLWAGASPELRHHVRGLERADSWATDAHKWLNVPYDSGLVFCAHPEAHRAALTAHADYLEQTAGKERDPFEWAPEFSRRARGFTVWAALRHLGRSGVADLVERCCRHARRFADRLATPGRVEILNEVVLNQVLVRFTPVSAGSGALERWRMPRRATSTRARSSVACRRTAPAGSRGRPGEARRRCASRSPTGRPPRRMSIAPPPPSGAPRSSRTEPLPLRTRLQEFPGVGNQPARIHDALTRRRHPHLGEGLAGRPVHDLIRGELELIPLFGLEVRTEHDLQSEIDAVLQEDARDRFRHHRDVVALERRAGLLAARAAAEILPADDDAAGGELPGLQPGVELRAVGKGELRRLRRQHGGHEAPGIDVVRADVVAELDDDLAHEGLLSRGVRRFWDR